jgi:hypothetical protein
MLIVSLRFANVFVNQPPALPGVEFAGKDFLVVEPPAEPGADGGFGSLDSLNYFFNDANSDNPCGVSPEADWICFSNFS